MDFLFSKYLHFYGSKKCASNTRNLWKTMEISRNFKKTKPSDICKIFHLSFVFSKLFVKVKKKTKIIIKTKELQQIEEKFIQDLL